MADQSNPFPASVDVTTLNRKHKDYIARERTWDDLTVLYEGGDAIRQNAENLLERRPREPAELFETRCNYISYTNVFGQAIGWYLSALFNDTPRVNPIDRKTSDPIENTPDFYADFFDDCDRGGTSFAEFWRQIAEDMLVYGCGYVLTDLPEQIDVATKAEEKLSGALSPYLVRYSPSSVINWKLDQYGNLEWAITATQHLDDSDAFAKNQQIIDRWYYFDRTDFAVYERLRDADTSSVKNETARLIKTGRHALADAQRVPLRRFSLKQGLWLGKRAYLPAKKHLTKENEYDWQLLNAAIALLVVSGNVKDPVQRSEIGWLSLPTGTKAEYLEPSGTSFEAISNRIRTLKEDIFRQMYLLAQARDSEATPAAQSGVSKQQDMTPSYEVCAGIGDALRDAMANVIWDVVTVNGHDDDFYYAIEGFNFDDPDPASVLNLMDRVSNLDIRSDTFHTEMRVRAAAACAWR